VTRPISIALISREYPPFSGGGIGTYARSVAPALARAGAHVHVITQAYDRTASVETSGRVTVHRLPLAGAPNERSLATLRFGALAGRRAAELHRDGVIDVAEAPDCEAGGFALATLSAAGVGAQPPLVVHLHTPTEQVRALESLGLGAEISGPLAAWMLSERAALVGATAVCAPSAFIADWAHARYALPARPTVIPYPLESIPRDVAPKPRRRVLFAGRIEPRKGVAELLQAWTDVARAHPDWTLRLAGGDTSTGPGSTSLTNALREALPADTRDRVEFLGPLPTVDLERERAAAAMCVIPSRWENFPYACIEAMASGRVVVVADNGGMREMVGESEGGRVVRAGDAADLAAGLSELIGEGVDRLAARGRAAQLQIRRLCDPSAVAERRLSMYRELIEPARACRRRPHQMRRSAESRLRLWRCLVAGAAGRVDLLDLPEPPGIGRPSGLAPAESGIAGRGEEVQPAPPVRRYLL